MLKRNEKTPFDGNNLFVSSATWRSLVFVFLSSIILNPQSIAASAQIIDIGGSIDEVYQKDIINGACEKYWKSNHSSDFEVLCGKEIFFHLKIKTDIGIPDQLLSQLRDGFKEEVGSNFEKLGFYLTSSNEPLGLTEIEPLNKLKPKDLLTFGKIKQISCAACHVGKLPDGRYSVGMPNENLDISRFNLLAVYPMWLATPPSKKTTVWIDAINEYYEQVTTSLKQKKKFGAVLKISELVSRMKLEKLYFSFLTQDPPSFGDQRTFFKGSPGIYNAAAPMLSFGEREIMSTPPVIWDINQTTPELTKEPYYGTITSANSFDGFLRHAFAYSSLTDQFSKGNEFIKPLKAYLLQLKTPKISTQLNSNLVEIGSRKFQNHCHECHDAPQGASSKRWPVDAVGSPKEYDNIFSDFTGSTRQSVQLLKALESAYPFEKEVYGIKARRLGAIWARSLIMTNGSVKGLDDLFCLNQSSPLSAHDSLEKRSLHRDFSLNSSTNLEEALATRPHSEICLMQLEDKLALREYLKSL